MTFARNSLAAGVFVILFSVTGAFSPAQSSSSRISGSSDHCYKMMVLRVIDGDTVYGYIDTSDPIVAIRAKLRLIGINAPERGRRAFCDAERSRGERARVYVEKLLAQAIDKRTRSLVRACDIKRGKYATRRLGRLEVRLDNGWEDVGDLLLGRGLAVPSKTGKRTRAWCRSADGQPVSSGDAG